MYAPNITAVVITKNEEKHIQRCLESIAWVDEIIVIDAESTDRTIDLCMKYTNKVYIVPWKGFAAQKNYGIQMASNTWIISIDADERITPELRNEIEEKLLKSQNKFSGFYIPRKNYWGKRWLRYAAFYPDYQLRLFRKDRGHFIKEIHEVIELQGEVGYLCYPLEHYTYSNISDCVVKAEAYTSIAANQVEGKVSSFSLIIAPFKTLLVYYVLRNGWRDGTSGLIMCMMRAISTFLTLAKAWEKNDHCNDHLQPQ